METLKSWQTTLFGIAPFLIGGGGLCVEVGQWIQSGFTQWDWSQASANIAACSAGLGLFRAKDVTVHSTTNQVMEATHEAAAPKR